jgi:hypothetical protein
MTATLDPAETLLEGKWLLIHGRMVADDACERIDALLKSHLVLLGRDSSGWDALYRDPVDERLWEHIYPQGHMHGGGPPMLRFLAADVALAKYGNIAGSN